MKRTLTAIDAQHREALLAKLKQAHARGEPADVLLRKQFAGVVQVKGINEEERTVPFVISTESIDRDSDTIAASGWRLANYKKNPVVLWAHDAYDLPIARAESVKVESKQLVSVARFADRDANPRADMVFRLLMGGFLNATSVGFMPMRWEYVDSEDRPFGVDFKEQELLEWSVVPVPANPEALMQAHAKGIDTTPMREWAERVLDEHVRGLDRGMVERAWKASAARIATIDLRTDDPEPEPKSVGAASYTIEHDHETDVVSVLRDGEPVLVATDAFLASRKQAPLEEERPVVELLARHLRAKEMEVREDHLCDCCGELSKRVHVLGDNALAICDSCLLECAGTFAEIGAKGVPQAKAGRVLSAANESKLRTARDEIDAVLAAVEQEAEEDAAEVPEEKDAGIEPEDEQDVSAEDFLDAYGIEDDTEDADPEELLLDDDLEPQQQPEPDGDAALVEAAADRLVDRLLADLAE